MLRPNLVETQFIFTNPPENFSPKMEVGGCFIRVEDHFLFLKQRPDDSEANTWGVPGGKFEQPENAVEETIREVYEETGLNLKEFPPCFKGKVYIRYPEMDFIYTMFEACLENYPPAVVIDPAEHTEYRWMTLETALKLPLIRGEDECIHLIYGNSLLDHS